MAICFKCPHRRNWVTEGYKSRRKTQVLRLLAQRGLGKYCRLPACQCGQVCLMEPMTRLQLSAYGFNLFTGASDVRSMFLFSCYDSNGLLHVFVWQAALYMVCIIPPSKLQLQAHFISCALVSQEKLGKFCGGECRNVFRIKQKKSCGVKG